MSPVRVERLLDGRVLSLELARPPKNILDGEALAAITAAVRGAADERPLRALLLCAEGPNFSVGASVPEHTRALAPAMLDTFYGTVRALLAPGLPICAAVSGHCLGGGLELVLPATHVVLHAGARVGQPEIKLAALAPIASILLRGRVGQACAEDLLLTGRTLEAGEALRMGLVDAVVHGNPREAALTWIEQHLLPQSASALRVACRAARAGLVRELDALLGEVDRLYREELLATEDAEEGIRAFIEKRPPRWSDR